MVKKKYVCETCNSFESYDYDEVEEHELNTPLQDIGIEGLVLKDEKGKYHFFNNADHIDYEHRVHYKKNIVCEEEKSSMGLVAEAKAMDMAFKAAIPNLSIEKQHTPDQVMAKRLANSGWKVVDYGGYNLYFDKESFQEGVAKEKLFEMETDEFIDVVQKIKEANPEYSGVKFRHKIPDELR